MFEEQVYARLVLCRAEISLEPTGLWLRFHMIPIIQSLCARGCLISDHFVQGANSDWNDLSRYRRRTGRHEHGMDERVYGTCARKYDVSADPARWSKQPHYEQRLSLGPDSDELDEPV